MDLVSKSDIKSDSKPDLLTFFDTSPLVKVKGGMDILPITPRTNPAAAG